MHLLHQKVEQFIAKERVFNLSALLSDSRNKYFDPYQKVWTTKIFPGEYHVSKPGEMIVTTLGSCISACIRDKKTGVGGMNHFMLPISEKGEWAGVNASTRFGNFAMEHLINKIISCGGSKIDMEASILGGGLMFGKASSNTVGENNIKFAKEYLLLEKIPLVYEDVGEEVSRKVYFSPENGKIIVKKLASLSNDVILNREESLARDIAQKSIIDNVEIF